MGVQEAIGRRRWTGELGAMVEGASQRLVSRRGGREEIRSMLVTISCGFRSGCDFVRSMRGGVGPKKSERGGSCAGCFYWRDGDEESEKRLTQRHRVHREDYGLDGFFR